MINTIEKAQYFLWFEKRKQVSTLYEVVWIWESSFWTSYDGSFSCHTDEYFLWELKPDSTTDKVKNRLLLWKKFLWNSLNLTRRNTYSIKIDIDHTKNYDTVFFYDSFSMQTNTLQWTKKKTKLIPISILFIKLYFYYSHLSASLKWDQN